MLATEAGQRAGDHERHAGERAGVHGGPGRRHVRALRDDADLDQLAQNVARRLIGEPVVERSRDRRADAGHLGHRVWLVGRQTTQLGLHRRKPRIGQHVLARHRIRVRSHKPCQPGGKVHGGLLADLRHPQSVEHACQWPSDPCPCDPPDQILRALLGEALQRLEVLGPQPEEVGPGVDHAPLQELAQDRPAGALDIHPAAPDEVAVFLGQPRGTALVGAIDPDRALVLDDGRSADRAVRRHLELALRTGPPLHQRSDDLRDHVPGLLENDPVADPDVLAAHLVEVVECGPRNGGPRDLDRRHVGDRCEGPRPPDVRHDGLDERLDLLRRELEGDRPARGTADHPEPSLLVKSVDLDDDTIGLVRKSVTGLTPALGEGDDTLDVETGLVLWVDREADRCEAPERDGLGIDGPIVIDQLVEPGRQPAPGGDGRVDLAE